MESSRSGTDDVSTSNPGGWRFPLLLVGVVAVMVWVGVVNQGDPRPVSDQPNSASQAAQASPTPQPEGASIRLEIDFGNGVTRNFSALAWHEGMTVADLMDEARRFCPGIEYQQQGQGAMSFLTSIDRVMPTAAGNQGWKYRVNGQHAEVSFGICPLQPNDHVLWKIESE